MKIKFLFFTICWQTRNFFSTICFILRQIFSDRLTKIIMILFTKLSMYFCELQMKFTIFFLSYLPKSLLFFCNYFFKFMIFFQDCLTKFSPFFVINSWISCTFSCSRLTIFFFLLPFFKVCNIFQEQIVKICYVLLQIFFLDCLPKFVLFPSSFVGMVHGFSQQQILKICNICLIKFAQCFMIF